MNNPCPCGSEKEFDNCCGAIIRGERSAETAEQLMRSRYTAFSIADADYLMKSWHPRTCPVGEKDSIRKWAKSVKWVKLQILATKDGLAGDDKGMVKFRALFLEKGKPDQIMEQSSFEKVNGEWVYVDGIHG